MEQKSNLKIKIVKTSQDLKKVLKIRQIVFIKGQKVPKKLEQDQFDKSATHFIATLNDNPVGCARICFKGKKAKLERITLLEKYRGKGFGKIIVSRLVRHSKDKGVKIIFMNAQYYLKNYYNKLGFNPTGKPFVEAGIKHIKMFYT